MSDETDPVADENWDADDPRRQRDCFAPPKEACECSCLHCGRIFSSDEIWFQRVISNRAGDLDGFWMCPTNNCGGAGFTFDIFPTDPDHPANAGWHDIDEADDDDDDAEDEFDADVDSKDSAEGGGTLREVSEENIPFDDAPPDDFIEEGDEWKLGYAPDQPPPPGIYGSKEMRDEQEKYDLPDERPRVIDRSGEPPEEPRTGQSGEDDIPF